MESELKIFQLNCNLKLRKEQFGGLGFVPETGEVIQLNKTGYGLLEKLLSEETVTVHNHEFQFWHNLEKRTVVKQVMSDEKSN